MELIESPLPGQHMLGFTPAIRMCLKGFLIGSIVSSIRPENEDFSEADCFASSSKIGAIAGETFDLLMYNIYGEPNRIGATTTHMIIATLLNAQGSHMGKLVLKIAKKVATVFFKFALLVNIVIISTKEGGLVPMVALTIYFITSAAKSTKAVPPKVSEKCYICVRHPLYNSIFNTLIYTGKMQQVYLAMVIGHLAYICYLGQFGSDEQKKKYYDDPDEKKKNCYLASSTYLRI